MCSGRRRSNGRRIEMEKSPAALRRCRIIFVWGPNSPLAALILWRETTKFVIARRPKADVAILQYPAESWESDRQKRSCLPEIATAPLGPRNDKLGSIARSTMPSYHLPACKARRERRYRRNWLVRFCRQPVRIASACRIPIADTAACAATHEKQTKFRKIPLFFLLWRAIMNLQNRSTLFLRPIIVDNVKGAYL